MCKKVRYIREYRERRYIQKNPQKISTQKRRKNGKFWKTRKIQTIWPSSDKWSYTVFT